MKKNNKCKKYGLAITDYVIGEAMDISRKELFDHLRVCGRCREDIRNWQATYSVLRARSYDARPGVRKRLQALIKESLPVIKRVPGERILNHEKEIGAAAGVVWHCLARNGKVKLDLLNQKVRLPLARFNQAIGWLAKENKVCLTRKKQTAYIYLVEAERQKYQTRV